MSGFAFFAFLGSLIGGAALDSYEARKGRERLEAFRGYKESKLDAEYSTVDGLNETVGKIDTRLINKGNFLGIPYRNFKWVDLYGCDVYKFETKPKEVKYNLTSLSPFEINIPNLKRKFPDFISRAVQQGFITNKWEQHIEEYNQKSKASIYNYKNRHATPRDTFTQEFYNELAYIVLLHIQLWVLEVEERLWKPKRISFTDFSFFYEVDLRSFDTVMSYSCSDPKNAGNRIWRSRGLLIETIKDLEDLRDFFYEWVDKLPDIKEKKWIDLINNPFGMGSLIPCLNEDVDSYYLDDQAIKEYCLHHDLGAKNHQIQRDINAHHSWCLRWDKIRDIETHQRWLEGFYERHGKENIEAYFEYCKKHPEYCQKLRQQFSRQRYCPVYGMYQI